MLWAMSERMSVPFFSSADSAKRVVSPSTASLRYSEPASPTRQMDCKEWRAVTNLTSFVTAGQSRLESKGVNPPIE